MRARLLLRPLCLAIALGAGGCKKKEMPDDGGTGGRDGAVDQPGGGDGSGGGDRQRVGVRARRP